MAINTPINTLKFSQMTNVGNIPNNSIIPGLQFGNVTFNVPWTFLPSGSTADRPNPIPAIYNLLRFNTDTFVYEYYDSNTMAWTELSGSGTGTVNPGNANSIAYYAATGSTVSPLNTIGNALLVTNSLGQPSFATTLPTGLTIPGASISGATITSSTAALTSGQVAATPANGTDIANKAYVDASFGSGVTSITGTTNQIIASSATGAVTLSTPQDIAPGSSPEFVDLTLSGGSLLGFNGLPVLSITSLASAANWISLTNQVSGQTPGFLAVGSDTNVGIELAAQNAGIISVYTTSNTGLVFQTGTGYQHITNFNLPNTAATRTVTFPDASGTVAYTSSLPTPAAMTEVNDTNVTLTLGGTPATSLLQAVSLTLGWTGTLSPVRGGTGVNNGFSTLTLGGNLATSGAFASTFTFTNTTAVTFPTSGTLATTSQLPSPAALTSSNDTNVTITLGGTPSTALLQATSLTMGWNGTLAVGRGGTGVGSVTTAPTVTSFAGWDANKNLSANAHIPGFSTTVSSGTPIVLTVSSPQLIYITGTTAQTVTMPVASTLVAGMYWQIVNLSTATVTVQSSGANTIVAIAASSQSTLTCILNSGTTAASWSTDYTSNTAGVSSITGTANQVIASSSTGAVTLSLPQSIGTTNIPTFAGVILPNSATAFAGLANPTVQQFIGGSGTYTTPTNPSPIYIRVIMVGGGGGGAGSGTSPGTATAGGNTTFGVSVLTANGGAANTGTPGTASLGGIGKGISLQGSWGGSASSLANGNGGNGGCSALGGGGYGGAAANAGHAAVTNTGSGGGGGGGGSGTGSGGGGSSGGYIDAIITNPNATYAYAVGGAGTGGTAGTGGYAGANGGSGSITVFEYYQ